MQNSRIGNIVSGCMSVVALCLTSCVEQIDYQTDPSSEVESFPIRVYVEDPCLETASKSSFESDRMDSLTDLNIFVYHDGLLLEDCSVYYDDMSETMLSFPVGTDGFSIYMLGNVGCVSAPPYESQMREIRHIVGDYAEFKEHGVPVAGTFKDYRKGDLAEFPLKRLVGQFDIRMEVSAQDADYVIKDIRVMNCAKDVYPFSRDSKAVLFTRSQQYDDSACGDMLTQSDIDALNSGKSVSLYFLENLQGELLPGNTDPKKKIPSYLPSGVAGKCTYIEITADVTTQAARYTDCRYRFYPGRNETTDFSILRNTLYEVLLDFTQNMVSEQEWRIEAQYPEVVGIRMNKEEAMVIKGAEDMIFVQAYGNDGELLDIEVEMLSSTGKISVEKVRTSYLEDPALGEAIGLRFTSNVELCGLYPYDSEPSYYTETVRISSRETYNDKPLYVKDVKVRVYDKLFPLLIKLEQSDQGEDGLYEIVIRGQNPMRLALSVSGIYVSNGSVLTVPKRARGVYYSTHDSQIFYDNSVSVKGTSFSSLVLSRPSDLSRIDFHIEGLSEISDNLLRLAYPRLSRTSKVYTGPDTEAVLGPGAEMSPGNLMRFSDDSPYYITWLSGNSTITRPYNYDDGKSYGSASYNGLREAWITSADRSSDFPDDYASSYLFGLYRGVHSNSYDGMGQMYENWAQYGQAPFYFLNGGLVGCGTSLAFPGELPRWPNEVTRGLEYDFLACGRDLFSENEDGSVVGRHHKMGMKISTWRQAIGKKVRTSLKSRFYDAQLYMTINGASCWCGNDITEAGYFPED